ncbi:endonuclease [Vibrio phage PWH3a-P1]|uniref:endonuclease n=1 Tax=Vibrio phage PWH3a-P1 TaxID=754058 RepID=UPI0002C0D567|nr:endonuclease [Vibrio phage PWH3a-P1]AGH32020.1 hypothetical protein VPIG_00163 [Vibrio phage PWH3a-P1]
MKEKEDGFIGTQFPTPKGGTLTVIERYTKNKHIKYIYECSICSEDEDLFPYGSITSRKEGILNGNMPCGCTKKRRWTEAQNLVRVRRASQDMGYVFNGWYGEYKGGDTRLDLYNPRNNNRWFTNTVRGILAGSGDRLERFENTRLSNIKPDKEHIQKFYEAGFTDDYKFWRSERISNRGYKDYWYYTCPICSNDEYTQNGVCSGVFESVLSSLRLGRKSCRCGRTYQWTQEQREYKINKICHEEGLPFIGWKDPDGYKNNKSKMIWRCSVGHLCKTNVDSFLYGTRCSTCWHIKRKELGYMNGYYPDRVDEKDYLYIINFNDKYIKIGRSFDIKNRIAHTTTGLLYCSGLPMENIKILQIYTSNHQTVYDTEQWLHEELRERGFEYNEPDGLWSIELFELSCIQTLNYLLSYTELEVYSDNII